MTALATKSGIAAVVDELAAAPEEEQLAFLPMRQGATPDERERMRRAVAAHRGPGRPLGAKNLATRQALDFVRRVLGDPMIERARMAMHTPESLSIELGCTKLEAAQFIDSIRADLSRLFYAPLAPVDGEGNAVPPTLVMQVGGAARAPGAADLPPWEYARLIEQNQPLAEPGPDVSHGDKSHAEGK